MSDEERNGKKEIESGLTRSELISIMNTLTQVAGEIKSMRSQLDETVRGLADLEKKIQFGGTPALASAAIGIMTEEPVTKERALDRGLEKNLEKILETPVTETARVLYFGTPTATASVGAAPADREPGAKEKSAVGAVVEYALNGVVLRLPLGDKMSYDAQPLPNVRALTDDESLARFLEVMAAVIMVVQRRGLDEESAFGLVCAQLSADLNSFMKLCPTAAEGMQLLMGRFCSVEQVNRHVAGLSKSKQRQDESAATFASRLLAATRAVPRQVSALQAVELFRKGLHAEWFTSNQYLYGKMAEPASLEAVIQYLMQNREATPQKKTDKPRGVASAPKQGGATKTVATAEGGRAPPPPKDGKKKEGWEEHCAKCGRDNHNSKNCKSTSTVTSKPKSQSGSTTTNSVQTAGSRKAILALSMTTGRELLGELDSGSETNLIDIQTAKLLGLAVSPLLRPCHLQAANKGPINVMGEATVDVFFGDSLLALKFLVVDGLAQTLFAQCRLPGQKVWPADPSDALLLDGHRFVRHHNAVYRQESLSGATVSAALGKDFAPEPELQGKWAETRVPVPTKYISRSYAGVVKNLQWNASAVNWIATDQQPVREDEREILNLIVQPDIKEDFNHVQLEQLTDTVANMVRSSNEHLLMAPVDDGGDTSFRLDFRDGVKHTIEPCRKVKSEGKREAMQAFIDDNLAKGRMVRMDSASNDVNLRPRNVMNLCAVPKGTGFRVTIDAKVVNSKLKDMPQTMPSTGEVKARSNPHAKFFVVIDLKDAFFTIPAQRETWKDLCVYGVDGAIYAFTVMPFGIMTAPQVFRDWTRKKIGELQNVLVYVDDILIEAVTLDELLTSLERLRKKIDQAKAGINPTKIHVGRTVKFLGELRSVDGYAPDPDLVHSLLTFREVENQSDVRAVLGIFRQVANHVPHLAEVLAPLNALTSSTRASKLLTDEEKPSVEETLDKAKKLMVGKSQPTVPRRLDLECTLTTDASDKGMGGALSQTWEDGSVKFIKFFSKGFSMAEQAASAIWKESRAIMYGVEQCMDHLVDKHFVILTDHKPLLHIFNKAIDATKGEKKAMPMYRHAAQLASLNYTIRHIKGTDNVIADALSRAPFVEARVTINEAADGKGVVAAVNAVEEGGGLVTLRRLLEQQGGLAEAEKFFASVSSADLHALLTQSAELELDGSSFRFKTTKKFYVLPEKRLEVLEAAHNALTAGHFGPEKVLARLDQIVAWPRMTQDVTKHCRECGLCQRNKAQAAIKGVTNAWPTMGVMERVHVDLMEFQPTTERGFVFALVAVDSASKKVWSWPLLNKQASTIATVLMDWFDEEGLPWILVSDGGGEFNNQLLARMCSERRIMQHITTPHHHDSNGMVEVMNRIVAQTMRMITEPDQSNWDIMLKKAVVAWNNSVPGSGAQSPDTIFRGRLKRTPLEVAIEVATNRGPPDTVGALATESVRTETARELRDAAMVADGAARAKAAARANAEKGIKEDATPLAIGDLVLVKFRKTRKGKARKLLPKQQGPFRVISIEHNATALLENVSHPADRLRRGFGDLVRYRGSSESIGDDEYEVERIVDERTHDGSKEYKVRWKHYDHSMDSWRKEQDLVGAADLLQQWEKQKANPKPEVFRVASNDGDNYLVALEEDMGPQDYVWLHKDQIANPEILAQFHAGSAEAAALQVQVQVQEANGAIAKAKAKQIVASSPRRSARVQSKKKSLRG